MKFCNKCCKEKAESEFHKNKARKDNLCAYCKICMSDMAKSWQSKNTERHAENKRRWKKLNPKESAAHDKKYQSLNRDKARAKDKAWRAANPDKIAAAGRSRRAAKKNAAGSHTAADVKLILDRQRGMCANCNQRLIKSGAKKYHVDHIHPLARGGSNDKYNLQCLCPQCNLKKNAKDPLAWAQENGRLI